MVPLVASKSKIAENFLNSLLLLLVPAAYWLRLVSSACYCSLGLLASACFCLLPLRLSAQDWVACRAESSSPKIHTGVRDFRLYSWIRKSTQIHTGAILHALDQDQQWVGQSSLCSCGILLFARLYFSVLWIAKGQYKDYVVVLMCLSDLCVDFLCKTPRKQTALVQYDLWELE